jgi:hypothetical protein
MALQGKSTKEMRIRRVPIEIHKAIVAHQGLMNQKSKTEVSLDEAAIDIWKKGILTIPSINQ